MFISMNQSSFYRQMMLEDPGKKPANSLSILSGNLSTSSWLQIAVNLWRLGRHIWRGVAPEGMYEVLEYESVLELMDKRGKIATLQKRKRVRYLQNHVIAYQDYGWTDGEQFLDYGVKPGIAVDKYKIGYKTYILISLREVRNRGDIDEFNFHWNIKNGFLKPDGFWETDISSPTKHLKVSVVFPQNRPPHSVRLVELNVGRMQVVKSDSIRRLPDGKWQATWQKSNPRLHEHYILRWDW
jgi:hypothetical protein